MPERLRVEILRELSDDLALLETRLGRSLDAWRQPRAAAGPDAAAKAPAPAPAPSGSAP